MDLTAHHTRIISISVLQSPVESAIMLSSPSSFAAMAEERCLTLFRHSNNTPRMPCRLCRRVDNYMASASLVNKRSSCSDTVEA